MWRLQCSKNELGPQQRHAYSSLESEHPKKVRGILTRFYNFCKIGGLEGVLSRMGRRLRFIPEGGAVVEITSRTVGARYLLKPSEELNEAIIGVLARAQRFYDVPLHALVFMSGHVHFLISVEDACQMARFMNYFNGNLATEAGCFNDWKEKFWGRRYQGIVVSNEDQSV